jgi:hypothetical protein
MTDVIDFAERKAKADLDDPPQVPDGPPIICPEEVYYVLGRLVDRMIDIGVLDKSDPPPPPWGTAGNVAADCLVAELWENGFAIVPRFDPRPRKEIPQAS